jgi:hypothetical protein
MGILQPIKCGLSQEEGRFYEQNWFVPAKTRDTDFSRTELIYPVHQGEMVKSGAFLGDHFRT